MSIDKIGASVSDRDPLWVTALCVKPRPIRILANSVKEVEALLNNETFLEEYRIQWRLNLKNWWHILVGHERYCYFKHLIKNNWPIPEEYFSGNSVPDFYLEHGESKLFDLHSILSAAVKLNNVEIVQRIISLGHPIRPDPYLNIAIQSKSVEVFKILELYLNSSIGGPGHLVSWTDFMIASVNTCLDLFKYMGSQYDALINWHKVAVALLKNNTVTWDEFKFIQKKEPNLNWTKAMNEDGTCCKARATVKGLLKQ